MKRPMRTNTTVNGIGTWLCAMVKSATFTVDLTAGKTKLAADFLDKDGEILCSAFFVKVTLVK